MVKEHIINGTKVEFEYIGRLTDEEVHKRIDIICKLQNYEFLGFVGEKWIGRNTHLILKCNNCGNIWSTITFNRFCRGIRCKKCTSNENSIRLTEQEAISKIENIIKERKNVEFLGFVDKYQSQHNTFLKLRCLKCGHEWNTCNCANFVQSSGCPNCKVLEIGDKVRKPFKVFVEEARKVHGDIYEYVEETYGRSDVNMKIICPHHGIFEQMPYSHLRGAGCPICNSSHLETEIRLFLLNNKIDFEEQKKFDWLKPQKLDFYLIDYNVGIECQGLQHFEPVNVFGGVEGFEKNLARDKRKRILCEENKVKLFYYSNLNISYQYCVYEDKEKLLKEIMK